jgi:hypothetical protein
MPEEAEEAGLVTRKSEKRFTDWAGSVRRWRSWKSSDDRRRRGMNNGSHEKLLTKPQADEVFSFTKPQWEARAAGSSLVPIDWHIRFSRHDTGLQIIGYEPITGFGFGFSVQPLYANDTDPPIMVIIRNYFLPGKLSPVTDQLQQGIEAAAQRSLGPTYKVKLKCGKLENFDSLEFTLTKP